MTVSDCPQAHESLRRPRVDFCRADGTPYHPEAFSKTFDRRLSHERFAGLPNIRLHDLRHTWASLALVAGVDIRIVSERLGHSNILITSNTYQRDQRNAGRSGSEGCRSAL